VVQRRRSLLVSSVVVLASAASPAVVSCSRSSDQKNAPSDGGGKVGGASNGGGTPLNGSSGGADNLGSGGTSGGGTGPASGGTTPGSGGNAAASGGATSGSGGNAAASGGATSDSGAPAVRVVGRTDGNAATPRFEWSGVSMQARFSGTTVAVDLDGGNNNYFEVLVDGITQPRIATTSGRKKWPLASGLAPGPHEVVLWRRTEANDYAPSTFYGFDFGGGTLLSIPAPKHRLEVVGDSITCGYGNEGTNPCSFSYDTENDYLAYGSVAARSIGADLYTECWSGKGVVRNYDGSTNDLVPSLFERTIPTESASVWDFSYQPEAVIVDLGTNDFHPDDPGSAFVDAYTAFATKLRGHYPTAWVFVVIGPMLGDPSLGTARGYLDQVVATRKAAGDQKIAQIQVDVQDAKNGIGCDYHPSTATDKIMGEALAAKMRPILGW